MVFVICICVCGVFFILYFQHSFYEFFMLGQKDNFKNFVFLFHVGVFYLVIKSHATLLFNN